MDSFSVLVVLMGLCGWVDLLCCFVGVWLVFSE